MKVDQIIQCETYQINLFILFVVKTIKKLIWIKFKNINYKQINGKKYDLLFRQKKIDQVLISMIDIFIYLEDTTWIKKDD